jgi:RNA polymerase sigma-70 factor (ECF subfamily)
MSLPPPSGSPAPTGPLSAIYPEALPAVYGYLVRRCGSVELAEDLTSTTFLAAADALRRGVVDDLSVPWLVGVARHKLVDHWRHRAVVERSLRLLDGGADDPVDPMDEIADADAARRVLLSLAPDHRAVLTLRYVDDLGVPETADLIGRSVRATESLLARARRAFRDAMEGADDGA